MKYKCEHCDNEFDEPKHINTTWELYYDIAGDGATPIEYDVCPFCEEEIRKKEWWENAEK